jgi:predicted lipid-binding transport protein (Tim44 family)
MNINFGLDAEFSTYVVLLIFTGLAMMVLATIPRSSTGLRLANGIFGLGFLGYGLYLAFMFQGGTYFIFFKAFILPAVLVFTTVKALISNRRKAEDQPAPAATQPE